ncbi:hypothetical protein EJ06DRAFT_374342 [Trichodelitschia bisporula]|uniref:Uncharacterized protein n=1 Tax=Trichodelitschia bisporula TaxID=703511 RepID=A0A6G1I1B3_9PEZI|nr:hypothetical protein EJ06DRAFT_374342 [Trichodelitschia bisporula]
MLLPSLCFSPALCFSPGEFPLVLLLGLGDSVSLEIGCRWSGCALRCRDQLQLLLDGQDRPRMPLRTYHSLHVVHGAGSAEPPRTE